MSEAETKLPDPRGRVRLFECAACGWDAEREEAPTICPRCGSAYVAEYGPDGDGDWEPEDGEDIEESDGE